MTRRLPSISLLSTRFTLGCDPRSVFHFDCYCYFHHNYYITVITFTSIITIIIIIIIIIIITIIIIIIIITIVKDVNLGEFEFAALYQVAALEFRM